MSAGRCCRERERERGGNKEEHLEEVAVPDCCYVYLPQFVENHLAENRYKIKHRLI